MKPKRRIQCDPENMTVGEQLPMFPVEVEPEPATVAGPARPAATDLTSVVNMRGRRDDPAFADVVYVGRPMYQGGWRLHGHLLANPFKIGRDGTAEEVVARYEKWLDAHSELVARELPKLRGKRLGCWCLEGEPCHARVLAVRADAAEVTP